jgi:FKBP12-rapamycin complex-associated protein
MAALQLGRWQQLIRQPLKHPLDQEYYQSCLAISKGHYEEAQRRINDAVSLIEKGGQTFTNYAASYEQLVRLQSLVELEEIVRFKRRFDCTCQDELYEYMVTKDRHVQQRTSELAGLVATWSDRLVFMEPKARWVEEFLAVRSLVASKTQLLPGYLQLADLYYHGGNETAYTALIEKLKASFDSTTIPVILSLTEIEGNLRLGQLTLDEAVKQAEHIYAHLNPCPPDRRQVFSKVGMWVLKTDVRPTATPTNFFERCLKDEQNDFELWHHYAICNYWMVKEAEAVKGDMNSKQLVNAIQGFAASLATNAPLSGQFTLQDLLRLLELWFDYHRGLSEQLQLVVDAAIKLVPTRLWLLIIRPLMTKLEASEAFLNSAKPLVASLAADYPQHLLFPLLLAAKSENRAKARLATRVLRQMELVDAKLIADATLFSEELIRVSVLFEELWYNGYCEIYKNRTEGKHAQSATLLGSLLERTLNSRVARTFNEISFIKKYGRHLLEMQELFALHMATQSDLPLLKAWDVINNLYRELEASLKCETEFLYLEDVSPELLGFKNSSIVIPGTLQPGSIRSVGVRVASVTPTLRLLRSKRRPRKVSVVGSDQKKYSFLLKGNEDLRLDERMMQLLGLLNDLFKAGTVGPRNELKIGTFSVVPLSYESGLISWVENCDTVFELIREHRQRVRLNVNFEKMLYSQFVEIYNQLSKTKKLEVYRFVAENSKADDLQKLFWQRALSADLWLSGRHTFTSSLAVMSMVGYIIGLGDRHLMNIMVERTSSLVIHIDFGDCFESAMLREKLPERIPFRLTRVLLNAMEVARTEGTFRKISEKVMEVMRTNRDVILAVLEEFVCDPILSWKVVQEQKGEITPQQAVEEDAFSFVEKPRISAEFVRKNKSKISMLELDSEAQVNIGKPEKELRVNEKALEALNRIRRKLIGKDFGEEVLAVPAQVDRLIREAGLPENICQAYIGWNPFL